MFSVENEEITKEQIQLASNISIEEGKSVFQNPWHWMSKVEVSSDALGSMWQNKTHPYIWTQQGLSIYFMVLHCNTMSRHPLPQTHCPCRTDSI